MEARRSLPALAAFWFLFLAISGRASAGGNLLANADFEAGNFSGWTLSGNTAYTMVTDATLGTKGATSYAPHGGNDYALLGPVGSLGEMSQTIATTAGQAYMLTWYLGSDGNFANEFSTSWNGNVLFDQKDVPTQGYVAYSETFVATSPSTTITFAYRDDPGYLSLDDVSLTAVIGTTNDPQGGVVPEPSALLLGGIGMLAVAGIAASRRTRRRRR